MAKQYIGIHLSSNRYNSVLEGIKNNQRLGFNCFQFFLPNPIRKISSLSKERLEELHNFKNYIEENNIKCFIHCPYTYNFSKDYKYKSSDKIEKYAWWIVAIIQHLEYAELMGVTSIVLHLGKQMTETKENAYNNMIESVKLVLNKTKHLKAKILLESPAGQGSEIGYDPNDLMEIFNKIDNKRLQICLDTCHVFVAGIDIRNPEILKNLLETYGIENIGLIHFNDSAIEFNGHIDRHSSIGKGFIGSGAMKNILKAALTFNIPLVLETPLLKKLPGKHPTFKYKINKKKTKEENDIDNLYELLKLF